MNPKVSINLCCYNSEKYLRETLDSIVNQTYKDWELIIINDGSSDSTEVIINEYIKQGYPIIYYYQENKGLGYSRNEALKRSQGEYIAFIDHDDIWMPDKLEKQAFVLKNEYDVDFLYSNYFIIKGRQNILASRRQQPQGHVFERFLYDYPVAILTVMVRKKAIEGFGNLFDRDLNLAEDYDFFMRLLYKSKAIYQNEPLAIYRLHSNMSSIKLMDKFPDETEHVFKKLGHLYPEFEKKYYETLKKRRSELEYLRAKMQMKRGDLLAAKKQIMPYRFLGRRYFILYLFSYLPVRFWNFFSLIFAKSPF